MVKLTLEVVRRRNLIEVLPVASVAIGRRAGELAVDMALHAVGRPVGPGQREVRLLMVESRRFPADRRMALHAVVVELTLQMARLLNLLEVALVASVTVERRPVEAIVRMTRFAGRRQMRAGERKSRLVVIDPRRFPAVNRMAGRAIVVVGTGNVIRVRSGLEGGAMAVEADRRSAVVPGRVTGRAVNRPVSAEQRERRLVVIDRSRFPARRGVTGRASVIVVPPHMVRVGDSLEIGLMAGEAILRNAGEAASGVASRAINPDVSAGELKTGQIMVELSRSPGVDRMALFTRV